MDLLLFGLGSIGLPFIVIFVYLDRKYGYKELFAFIFKLFAFIFKFVKAKYLRFATGKYGERKFELSEIGNYYGENYLKEFAKGLEIAIFDPIKSSVRSITGVAEYIYEFETDKDKNGKEFLDRVSLIIKDKSLHEKFINVEDIIRDDQYDHTPFEIFKRDLKEPLLQLIDKIIEYEIEIGRIEHKFKIRL